ncbi:cytoplasmic tRNA 2-thiolation protein 2 isoform X2 [Betta splendens]|uniref:Cytoplasmic tRNA 2-thiolation protein 2 n=1 Tax=Betta splendens TaxID=158456 RepID=A0A6P7KKI3_BETSP|nr:cytoplasmic tRNA 2-thiolation protein 2 isoform X2 [Betta splendens]
MCQAEEEYSDELGSAHVPSVSKKCVKCKEATAAVVIRAGDVYCRACFKEYYIHKFRATLGKNRVIFPGEKVLLAVSGGPSSCSMLHQVQEGLSQSVHKKLRFLPGIVYIDEGGAVGRSVEERLRTMAELQAVFKATGFQFYIVPLEEVLDLPGSVVVSALAPPERANSTYKAEVDHFMHSNCSTRSAPQDQDHEALPEVQESATQMLQQLMLSAKTLTARQNLLNTLRQHLLVHMARTRGYSKLMLGDSRTRLAVKLLTSLSLGRGAQLAQDTGFSDSRYGDIISVRPMRDHSAKEVFYYNHLFHVTFLFIPSLDTKMTDKASVQRLTESFVTKLQEEFPSTVSTIYRTSEKLQTAGRCSSTGDQCERCLLCLCTLDTAVDDASAFQATLISEQLSQTAWPRVDRSKVAKHQGKPESTSFTAQYCSAKAGAQDCGGCCSFAKEPEPMDLRSLLCYSCQLTIRDMSSIEHLPPYILSEAQRRHRRCEMREEISEFLLDSGKDD